MTTRQAQPPRGAGRTGRRPDAAAAGRAGRRGLAALRRAARRRAVRLAAAGRARGPGARRSVRDGRAFRSCRGATASATAGRISAAARSRWPPGHPAPPSGKHALHGLGWLRPWQVAEAGRRGPVCGLAFEADAPVALGLRGLAAVRARSLGAALHGDLDQPGFGADACRHRPPPVFPAPSRHAAAGRDRGHVAGRRGGDAGALEAGAEVARLREGVLLSELDLDNNFTGWQHEARIEWPDAGRTLRAGGRCAAGFLRALLPARRRPFLRRAGEPVHRCDQPGGSPRAARRSAARCSRRARRCRGRGPCAGLESDAARAVRLEAGAEFGEASRPRAPRGSRASGSGSSAGCGWW